MDGISDGWCEIGIHEGQLIVADETLACDVHRLGEIVGEILSCELEHDLGCGRVGLYVRMLTFVELCELGTRQRLLPYF